MRACIPVSLPLTRPLLPERGTLEALLSESFAQGILSNFGPLHDRLEQALSARLGGPAVLVSSGTAALTLALRALLPAKPSGEVITTAFTFAATLQAIELAGFTPVTADIDPSTLCLSPEAAKAAVTERTVAILPVHVFGRLCDFAAFEALSRAYGLPILYDGAHAFDCAKEGRPAASFGDATALSFHATKLFHTAEGGAVVFPGENAAATRARMLRNFGLQGEAAVLRGFNGKLSELHAAMGLAVLPLVEEERQKRLAAAARYDRAFHGCPGLTSIVSPNGQYYVLRLGPPFSRDAVYARLKSAGIGARRYFYPAACDWPAYRWRLSQTACPEARRAARECLALPLYGALSPQETGRIVQIVLSCHPGHRAVRL